jgi:hypothetical protein
MPRGLSDLQKRILAIAYERRRGRDLDAEREEGEALVVRYGFAPSAYKPAPDVYHAELLAEVWGFPHERLFPAERAEKFGEAIRGSGWWGQYFDRDAIGRDEYNRATTTLWRTAKRLEDRGLAVRAFYGKPGVFLTDQGLEVAARLSVETPQP